MLNNIRIVLLHTFHPGNIGSTARAMKTMGLTRLYLVQPREFPSGQANALASSAIDILEQATVCDSLAEAIADCEHVYGSGSEIRGPLAKPILTPREMAVEVLALPNEQQVALVFGCETSGMNNAEMALCQKQIQIPSHPDYDSLNLAAAVQVFTYELRMAELAARAALSSVQSEESVPLATSAHLESLYKRLRETMELTGFFNPAAPLSMMRKMRRVFNAAQLRKNEIDLLQGFLHSVRRLKK